MGPEIEPMRRSADIRPSSSTCAVVGPIWKSVTSGTPARNMPKRHSDSEEPGRVVALSSIVVWVESSDLVKSGRESEESRLSLSYVGIVSSGDGGGEKGGNVSGTSAMAGR